MGGQCAVTGGARCATESAARSPGYWIYFCISISLSCRELHNSCKYNKKSHGDSLKYAFWARSTDDPLVNFDIFFMISADYIV